MTVLTDVEIHEQMDANSLVHEPFGYFIRPSEILPFAIVSKSVGLIGYFGSIEDAVPWLRMLALRACRKQRAMDLRLYEWDAADRGWRMVCNSVELADDQVMELAGGLSLTH